MATPAILQEQLSPVAGSSASARPTLLLKDAWIQGVLFVATLSTTTLVGMRYMDNFRHGRFPIASDADIFPYHWVLANLSHASLGLPFSLTLLAILLTHEFGHYFACRAHSIRATLPYLLPAPSLSGTAGAVIRLKSRVKTRAALLAIGAFGPVSGFAVALVMACAGIALSVPVASKPAQLVGLNQPLLFVLLRKLFSTVTHQPFTGPLLWHPMLLASWIGLLITSLNLVPAGQLDGGHILYSISPRLHRALTWIILAVLLGLGIFYWVGWLLWGSLLLLPGMRHPKVQDETPLSRPMLALGAFCILIFILTATPMPFQDANLMQTIHWMRQ